MRCTICELPVSSSCLFCKPDQPSVYEDKFESLVEEPLIDPEDQDIIDNFLHQGRTAPRFYE